MRRTMLFIAVSAVTTMAVAQPAANGVTYRVEYRANESATWNFYSSTRSKAEADQTVHTLESKGWQAKAVANGAPTPAYSTYTNYEPGGSSTYYNSYGWNSGYGWNNGYHSYNWDHFHHWRHNDDRRHDDHHRDDHHHHRDDHHHDAHHHPTHHPHPHGGHHGGHHGGGHRR